MSGRVRQWTLRALPSGEPRVVRVLEGEGDGGDGGSSAGDLWLDLGEAGSASVFPSSTGAWSVLTPAGSFEAEVVSGENDELEVRVSRHVFRFGTSRSGAPRRAPGRTADHAEVRAPMPGKIVKLLAEEGTAVEAGQGILLFEAMKMQNEVRSPQSGVLDRVHVEEGQVVDAKAPLFMVRAEIGRSTE